MAQLTSDAYRKAYLADLDLQIENNEKNLQANLLHKRTGQVSTQITDYRTVTQKLADVVALRADVRKNLTQICDVPTAGEIVRECTDDEIRFLAQRIQFIISELKPKYRYGVPAIAFMTYLRQVMRHIGLAGEVDPGITIAGQINDIQYRMVTRADIGHLSNVIDQISVGQSKDLKDAIRRDLSEMTRVIAEVERLKSRVASSSSDYARGMNKAELADRLTTLVEEGLQHFPTAERAREFESALEDRQGDAAAVEEVLLDLHQEFAQPADQVDLIRDAVELVGEAAPAGAAAAEEEPTAGKLLPDVSKMTSTQIKKKPYGESRSILEPYIQYLYNTKSVPAPADNKAQLQKWYRANEKLIRDAYEQEAVPAPVVGSGFRRIRGRGIIDHSKGVKDKLKFAPLGRYYVNIHKLNDDILCMSRSTGTNIPSLPTRRLSKELACVFRKLVNGGVPTFNELAALNTADRDEYADVARKCQFAGGEIQIPETSGDSELTKFEIMKGEILSGNDSVDLVKQFKVMVLKLSHNGRLPKGQARELLMDLAALGY